MTRSTLRLPAGPRPSEALGLLRLAALSALCVSLIGCGGADEPPGREAWTHRADIPAAAGVTRLLPRAAGVDSNILFSQAFPLDPDISEWLVMAPSDDGGFDLLPADGHPEVKLERGFLSLTDVDASLLRLLLMPEGEIVELSARLHHDGPIELGDDCTALRVVKVHELEPESTARTVEQALTESRAPVAGRIKRRLSPEKLGGWARWTTARDADGLATASVTIGPLKAWSVLGLVLPAGGRAVAVQSVQCAERPQLRGAGDGGRAALHPSLSLVTLGDQSRAALTLPPGTPQDFEASLPTDPQRFSMSLAADPNAPAGVGARWRVEVAAVAPDAEPVFEPLVSGSLTAPEAEEVSFEEFSVRWPPEWRGGDDGRVLVRFAVEGESAVVVGQPMIHGAPAERPPNLLLISLDTLRADHLGSYGYERDTSPFLDGMAERGVRFERCTSVGPYTLPTHATMFTGLFPLGHGAVDTTDRLDSDAIPTLPRLLADAGWVTAGFTGGGFLSPDFGLAAGFDRFGVVDPMTKVRDGETRVPAAHAARLRNSLGAASDWVGQHREQPWFLFVHSYVVHEYDPPLEDFEPFDTAPQRAWEGPLVPHLRPGAWIDDPPSEGDVEHVTNLYDATVRFADRQLEQFLGVLREQGLLENTLVVITSDHGEELYEHGGMRHSVSLYEEMLAVPLIVWAPGFVQSRVVSEPVSQTDLMPTLLELLGQPVPDDLDGRSLAGLMGLGAGSGPGNRSGSGEGARTPAFAQIDTRFSRRESLTVGSSKIIHNPRGSEVDFAAEVEWELYDVRDDPGERRNLAVEEPDELARMRSHLEAVRALQSLRAATGSAASIDPEVMAQLEALGYVR